MRMTRDNIGNACISYLGDKGEYVDFKLSGELIRITYKSEEDVKEELVSLDVLDDYSDNCLQSNTKVI